MLRTTEDCERIDSDRYEAILRDDGFTRTPVRADGTTSDSTPSMYYKDIVQVLRNQVALSAKQDFIFRPDDTYLEHPQHPMETPFFRRVVADIQRDVKSRSDCGVYWTDLDDPKPTSFVGLVQIYSDKTATTLKANALIAYPIHAVLLNCSLRHRRYLIDNGYTLVVFLPVGTD